MRYGLGDDVRGRHLWFYGVQHLVFFVAGTTIMPIAVGSHLGMGQAEIAAMLQRSFLIFGVTTLLQVRLGHRYPIIDGPAGLWTSMLIIMAASAAEAGRPLAELRSDLELGIIAAGAAIMLVVALGLLKWVLKLFTPLVNGVIITTMVLQMSITLVRGVVGIGGGSDAADGRSMLIFFVTTAAILFVTVYMKGFLQSIATLIGVALGWLAAAAAGLWSAPALQGGIFSLPEPLAWGMPTLNPGITASCVIGELLLMSMTFASINSMSAALGEVADERKKGRSLLLQGFATVLSGVFPAVPPMPYISSTGVVLMTGVAARKPFVLACAMLIAFGAISPVSLLLASMPALVAYSTTIVIFALIFGQGILEFKKCAMDSRDSYAMGISMILGVGAMFLPSGAFSALPQSLELILSNGLVVGTLAAILLERALRAGRD
ncbi:MAG: purine/pyrimidine permease [Clostridiales Family XIII bacterium]|jgi:xanthine/uracil permease|nr:purine/pyrimidine permease [Clostridiales Family XIII bacterium]